MDEQSGADFWAWVEKRCEDLGLNLPQLEVKTGYTGAISERRNAEKMPSLRMAKAMCQVLKVPLDELLTKAGMNTDANARKVAEAAAASGIPRTASLGVYLSGTQIKPTPGEIILREHFAKKKD